MRAPRIRNSISTADTPMTSMIDVVFLLLIFFLCAAASQRAEQILPAELTAGAIASTQPLTPKERLDEVWVRLTHAAPGGTEMTINGTTYAQWSELHAVLQTLAEIEPRSPVILDIAPEVPAGDVVQVWDLCRSVGLSAIHFRAPIKS